MLDGDVTELENVERNHNYGIPAHKTAVSACMSNLTEPVRRLIE